MADMYCTTEGAGRGDHEVVADKVELVARCEEKGTARDGDTCGGDEVFAFTTSVPATSCSEFCSTRIEGMMASRSEFETGLEFRTAHSKVHWSELSHDGASDSVDLAGTDHN